MRDKIVGCIDRSLETCRGLEDIRPHNIWLPLSLIFASNIGAHITHDYFPVLLCNSEDCFVVGDQPIINTFAICSAKFKANCRIKALEQRRSRR